MSSSGSGNLKMALQSNKKRKAICSERESSKSETVPRVILKHDVGFIVEVLKEGNPDGEKAVPRARISVCYVGKLENGTIFDDAFRETPFEFLLRAREVVLGFECGVAGCYNIATLVDSKPMCVGEKRRITVPPPMGYSSRGDGNLVPPNARLVFEVEQFGVREIETTFFMPPLRGRSVEVVKPCPWPLGLSVEVLREGIPDGQIAFSNVSIGIRYTGSLLKTGEVFDRRHQRKTLKFKLGLGNIVRGLRVGINYMRVGEIRRITVPPNLGYIQYGDGNLVPPHAWLVFEVELVSVRLTRRLLKDPRYNVALQQ